MPFGSLSNTLEIKNAEGFRGSCVLQQSYPLTGYTTGAAAPAAFTPLSLFTGGVQGVWYDPSDLTTMFEDSAGTTPVHTPGNGVADSPVGKLLDKSGNANHATQSTSTARPTLSARYNLLTYSQDLTNSVWTKDNFYAFGSGSQANTTDTTDPLGTYTATKLAMNTTNGEHRYYANTAVYQTLTIKRLVYAKAGTAAFISISSGGSPGYAVFDLTNGVVSSTSGITSADITSAGNGWYACSIIGGTANFHCVKMGTTSANAVPGVNVAGTGEYAYFWGNDFRVSNDGVGLPAYQRVVDANTYDSTGFPYYIKSDGVDDQMTTGSINLSALNKLSSFVGTRCLNTSDAILFEQYGASGSTNAFVLYRYNNNGSTILRSGGSSTQEANSGATSTPATRVVTGLADISAPFVTLRFNGSQVATNTASQGTGNYANGPITVFARAASGAGLPYNGRTYGLILRAASSTVTEISNAETWMNTKTAAY